jgi:hypothetical protein
MHVAGKWARLVRYFLGIFNFRLHVLDMTLISVMCYNSSVSRKKYLAALGSFEKIPYNRFEENYIHF